MRVMQAAHEAPGLASSINIGAFNLGNAIGAALGGAAIAADLGYAAVPVVGGLTAAAGLERCGAGPSAPPGHPLGPSALSPVAGARAPVRCRVRGGGARLPAPGKSRYCK